VAVSAFTVSTFAHDPQRSNNFNARSSTFADRIIFSLSHSFPRVL
jgi:hypothetical protein